MKKKGLRIILVSVLLLFVTLHVGLYITGNTHLYKAITSTYLVGETGPGIDDLQKFPYHTLPLSEPQEWAVSSRYNTYQLQEAQEAVFAENQTAAFLVLKNDSLIFEKYWNGYTETSQTNSFSIAKTFTALAVGAAISDGLIGSVQDKAIQYLPELQGTYASEITIQHLLQMCSGMNFDESYDYALGYMAKAYYGSDVRKLTFSYKAETKPGTLFYYQGGNTLLLSFIVEKVSGMSFSRYFEQRIWSRLKPEQSAYWSTDKKETVKAYCCFYASARDFARVGKLLLDSGYRMEENIIPTQFLQEAVQPVLLPDASGNRVDYYGYQMWMTTIADKPVYYARGIKGQYIFVIPHAGVVAVRTGKLRSKTYRNNQPSEIFDYVETALQIAGE